MRGDFSVHEVVYHEKLGLVLRGVVVTGRLAPGMEARSGSIVIIIAELFRDPTDGTTRKHVRKGENAYLRPLAIAYDVLKAVEGRVLEFDDARSEPVKKGVILEPDLA